MNKDEKLKFKFEFDKKLDDVFFTNRFKKYITQQCKYCPDGLTIDTNIDDDEPTFVVCTKKYGYEYLGERVPGDYYDLKYEVDKTMVKEVMNYLYAINPELYDEIFKYDVLG